MDRGHIARTFPSITRSGEIRKTIGRAGKMQYYDSTYSVLRMDGRTGILWTGDPGPNNSSYSKIIHEWYETRHNPDTYRAELVAGLMSNSK
jgi:hypothetical protein